jgi:hypothetical protein
MARTTLQQLRNIKLTQKKMIEIKHLMSREGKCSRRLPTAALPIFRPLQELERSISETRSIYHEGRDLREVRYNKNVLVVVHVYISPSPRPLVSFYSSSNFTFIRQYQNTLSFKAHSFSHSLDQLLLHYLPTTTSLSSNKRLLHSLHSLQHTTHTQCVSNFSPFPYWLLSQRPLPSPASLAVFAQPAQSLFKTLMQPLHPCFLKWLLKALRLL